MVFFLKYLALPKFQQWVFFIELIFIEHIVWVCIYMWVYHGAYVKENSLWESALFEPFLPWDSRDWTQVIWCGGVGNLYQPAP